MLFNSFDYAIFLPIVFLFYWSIFNRSVKLQNLFILIVSYIFYGWWDWRFLWLIALSSEGNFILGIQIGRSGVTGIKKIYLFISIIANIAVLGVFKYFNFFLDSLINALNLFNYHLDGISVRIILPIGISFYTFQTLSYTVDVYRKKVEPVKYLYILYQWLNQ